MLGLSGDVRYALRQLRKNPGFAITAILMLALGISANSTIFSWINATLLHPVPQALNTSELVSIMRGQWNTSPSPPFSYPDYRDLRERNVTFSGILAYNHDWQTLTSGPEPQRIYAANVSANYFDVLGIRPFLGRFFFPDEEARPSGTPYVVLSYSLWQTRFAGDPAIVGRSIEISQRPFTVIGVAPRGFIGCMPGIRTDAWLPLVATGGGNAWVFYRDHNWLNVLGRLQPGVSRARATRDLDMLMQQIFASYPDQHLGVNAITLDPLWRSPFGANIYLSASLPLLLLMAGVVLLLTCANVATLALVRFVARRRELAIRQSLGATRTVLVRQMALEGALLAAAGGGLALLLTSWSARMLSSLIPPSANPIALNGYVDGRVITAIVLLAIASSALCGALPAWRSSHVTTADVLKDESTAVAGGGRNQRLLSALVVGQIALSLALLITSGLFLQTLRAASDADPGFDRTHVLTASVGLRTAGYGDAEIRAFQHKALDQLRTLPGVQAASLTDWLPLDFNRKTADVYPEGYMPQQHRSLEVRHAGVSAGYFDTLEIPIVQGRAFTSRDDESAPRVVIVDETAAAHYWPGQSAVGRRLHIFGTWWSVVGVARNTRHLRPSEQPEPMIYLPTFQTSEPETILQVRTAGDPTVLAHPIEDMVHSINARLPVFDVRTLEETSRVAVLFERLEAIFATLFGILALILAATGIYSVVAYRTELRTHEIGIRVALGAGRNDVLRLVLWQGVRLAALGLGLGLGFAFVLTRFLRGAFYGVSATDPWTAASVTVLLAGIAVLACYLPARRAMRVDPMSAIRTL